MGKEEAQAANSLGGGGELLTEKEKTISFLLVL